MAPVTLSSPAVPDDGVPPQRRRRVPRWIIWGFAAVAGFFLLVSMLLPDLCRASPRANVAKCASNLHQIGLAILLYQQDNGQAYPDTLGRLIENEQIGAEVFVCPASNDEKSPATQPSETAADIDASPTRHHCSYVYLGRGMSGNVPATTVVAYEQADDHEGEGSNVLFGDGHVDWETKAWLASNVPATTRPAP